MKLVSSSIAEGAVKPVGNQRFARAQAYLFDAP